jgi:hypothetical protein
MHLPPFEPSRDQAAREYDTLSHAVQVIERETYEAIRELAGDGSVGVTKEQAYRAIDEISNALHLRKAVGDQLRAYLAGEIGSHEAAEAMHQALVRLYGTRQEYSFVHLDQLRIDQEGQE